MTERSDEILCEVCEKRPATRIIPRGPVSPGHDPGYLNVCDACNPFVEAGDSDGPGTF
jgi:hypothetical protein